MQARVLQVVDKLSIDGCNIHGITRLLSWWIPYLEKQDISSIVCTLRPKDNAGKYLENLGIEVHYLNKSKYAPLTLTSLLRIMKRKSIDILHLHGYGAWTFGRIAGLWSGIPTIGHEHMVDLNFPRPQRLADWLLAGIGIQAVAVSDAVKAFMVRDRYLPEGRIDVIQNGIPLSAFRLCEVGETPPKAVEGWRTRLGIPRSHLVVGTVGRLHTYKGHQYFLEAAYQVLDQYSEVTFVIVGDGDLRRSLEDLTQRLGIASHVRFTGQCDDVAPLYTLMGIMVIASLADGGPLTLIEAMAAGCAIVSTDVIGRKDAIEDGKTGFLVPVQDATAIAQRICLLVEDKTRLKAMRTAAQKQSANFSMDASLAKLIRLYQKALKT